MNRFTGAVAAALAFSAAATAQPTPEPKDGKVTISMSLTPTATPKPLSRYYLMPDYRDQQPGERIGGFLKCFMEQDIFFNAESSQKRQKWLDMTLADLPKDVREQAGIMDGLAYDPPYTRMMGFMDKAARYTRTEWNEWFDIRKDGIYYLLPDVQKLRSLAQVLMLRMRGEVKNGEFVRAVETAKTMFGLANALREHPTLIGSLVGVAVSSMAIGVLEEMVQQPGCPNLFWSFTDLPAPLLPMRNGLGGERLFVTAQFSNLMTADHPMSDAELQKTLRMIEDIVKIEGGTDSNPIRNLLQNPRVRYTAWSMDAERVAAARKRLVEYGGMNAALVAQFPPLQVVLTDDLVQFEVLRDELMKTFNLPYPVFASYYEDAEKALKDRRSDLILGPLLLPALQNVKRAEARLDQRVAYLRLIEAVRLFAHENGGRLPNSLDEIKLPLPADPLTGKPFEYAVKDGVATLHGTNPQPGNPQTNRVYELRIAK